jgi:hypothetical protein
MEVLPGKLVLLKSGKRNLEVPDVDKNIKG